MEKKSRSSKVKNDNHHFKSKKSSLKVEQARNSRTVSHRKCYGARKLDEDFESDYESFVFDEEAASSTASESKPKKKSWKKTLTSFFKRKHSSNCEPRNRDPFHHTYNYAHGTNARTRSFSVEDKLKKISEDDSSYYGKTEFEKVDDYSEPDFENLHEFSKKSQHRKEQNKRTTSPQRAMPKSMLQEKQSTLKTKQIAVQHQTQTASGLRSPRHRFENIDLEYSSESEMLQSEVEEEESSVVASSSSSYAVSTATQCTRVSGSSLLPPTKTEQIFSSKLDSNSKKQQQTFLAEQKSCEKVPHEGLKQLFSNKTISQIALKITQNATDTIDLKVYLFRN